MITNPEVYAEPLDWVFALNSMGILTEIFVFYLEP